MKKNAKKLKYALWGGRVLFLIYLAGLCYFLFFAENYGRVFGQENYRYNLIPFKEIERFWKYRSELGIHSFYNYDTKTLIPLLEYIKNNSTWNSLVTSVNVAPSQDIFLVPAIRGHVINFGDTSLIEDKFSRLHKMYNKVMPAKGWEYYDTLSVKWKGQIVATRAKKKTHSELTIICTTDTADIVDDIETMTATPTPQQ